MSKFGFNFRKTYAYVTDSVNDSFVVPDNWAYPKTHTIESVDYVAGAVIGLDPPYNNSHANVRDRSNSVDPRIAGLFSVSSAQLWRFRVDLPETGHWRIRVASCDMQYGSGTLKLKFFDSTDQVYTMVSNDTLSTGSVIDVNGTKHVDEAAWLANDGYVDIEFATTEFYLELGDAGDNGSSAISHVSFEKIAPPSTTTETLDNVTLEPAAGKQYVTIGATPDLSYKSLLYGTNPSATNPDQLEADTLTSDGKAITLNGDGTFSIANVGTNVQTFQYRIYDMDGDGWSAMATATVTPVPADSEKPVITLIGDPVVEVFLGDAYTDAGANVTDNVDANAVLVAQGSVNVTTLGSYTLTYDYTDAAGNIADTVTRTVNVIPAQIPIVESTSNPLPSEITIIDTYDLSQHVDNPDGAPLSYSVVGGTLPAEVTLNASTGVLTKEYGAIYEAVSGITFNVVRV